MFTASPCTICMAGLGKNCPMWAWGEYSTKSTKSVFLIYFMIQYANTEDWHYLGSY